MKLDFVHAPLLLRETCPPTRSSILWKHPKLDMKIEAGGVNIICSDDSKKSLRYSAMIAGEIARNKKQQFPSRLNPFTGLNEGAGYDAHCAAQEKNMNVLYINSLTTEYEVEEELVKTLPKMDEWVWIDRDKGREFPYSDLGLHILSVRSGTIMKQDEKRELRNFIKDNRIHIIILNSFEFTCRTQREKDDLVDLLKVLRDEFFVSILVFTHEPVKRFAPGSSRRGPLGTLSILASWARTIDDLAPELDAELYAQVASESQ
jgi:hypothetical protein